MGTVYAFVAVVFQFARMLPEYPML